MMKHGDDQVLSLRIAPYLLCFVLLTTPVLAKQRELTASTLAPCDEWARLRDTLQERDKTNLRTLHVAWNGRAFVFSRKLVSDCEFSLRLGRYWGARLNNATDKDPLDAFFVRHRMAEAASILRVIWPALQAGPLGDGAFGALKFSLLVDPELPERALAGIVIDDLRRYPIFSEIAHILMDRPVPATLKTLRTSFYTAKRRGDFLRQIYTAACLSAAGQSVRPLWAALTADRRITQDQRDLVNRLSDLSRIRRLEFRDIEDLQYDSRYTGN